jgi:glycosyltransferase involved in cell wall biosynthesis
MKNKEVNRIVTIFTPTFNRAHLLIRLYESLKIQSSKNFVWLIIDDGSTDSTKVIVEQWIKESNFEITYQYQSNFGKSSAFNNALSKSNTLLFFPVDSDDYLAFNCIEEVINSFNSIHHENLVGLIFKKISQKGNPITILNNNSKNSYDTLFNFYQKKILTGDAMLVYYTSVINKYRFPQIKDEKFFPEAYIYDLIDEIGLMSIINKNLYIVEYLDDGISSNMLKVIFNNPLSFHIFYYSRFKKGKIFRGKLIQFVKFLSVLPLSIRKFSNFQFILLYPLSLIIFIVRFYRLIK